MNNCPKMGFGSFGNATVFSKQRRIELEKKRNAARVAMFAKDIRTRHQPQSRAEEACVQEMALAAWKLKGADVAEKKLVPEGARLLIPFKQQAYNDYMTALHRLQSLRLVRAA